MSVDLETGSLATVTCVECGRQPRPGEVWHLDFADVAEVAVYCSEWRSGSSAQTQGSSGVKRTASP
jgi:hypothetical protein